MAIQFDNTNTGTVTLKPPASGSVALVLPSADGTSGQLISTDGSGNLSFITAGALPSQTGNSGKYLTTDGTDASWATLGAFPSGTAMLFPKHQRPQAGQNQRRTTTRHCDWFLERQALEVLRHLRLLLERQLLQAL